jgi:hypothetical protein
MVAGAVRRVFNPKIWEGDTRRFRGPRFEFKPWLAACRDAIITGRRRGDPMQAHLQRTSQALALTDREASGRGAKRRMSFMTIAAFVGCCIDTARRCVRWLEARGLVDTFNVLVRVKNPDHPSLNGVFRTANMYMLRMPEAPPEAPGTAHTAVAAPAEEAPPAVQAVLAATARLARWAAAFGLVARPWGLNATPLPAVDHRRTERRTAPA